MFVWAIFFWVLALFMLTGEAKWEYFAAGVLTAAGFRAWSNGLAARPRVWRVPLSEVRCGSCGMRPDDPYARDECPSQVHLKAGRWA